MPDHSTTESNTVFTKRPAQRLTAIIAGSGTPMIVPAGSPSDKRPRKRMTTQLQLPRGRRDLEAVKVVIGDWLVPLLVKEFLLEHKAGTNGPEVDGSHQTKKPSGRKR
jgi:hypothetical protein